MQLPSAVERAAGSMRSERLAAGAVLLAALLVGIAVGQLVRLVGAGDLAVVGAALAAVVVGLAVAIAVGVDAAGARRTPYW